MTGNPPQKPHLILVVLPENAADVKLTVKRWGDIERGVVTQCIVSRVHAHRFPSSILTSRLDSVVGNGTREARTSIATILP